MIAIIRYANQAGEFLPNTPTLSFVNNPSDETLMKHAKKFSLGAAYRIEFYHDFSDAKPYRVLEQMALPLIAEPSSESKP